MSIIQSDVYAARETELETDPAVQLMAAELRHDQVPYVDLVDDTGSPHQDFVLGAAQEHHRTSNYEGALHLGAVATVVLRLAFDRPPRRYVVWPGGSHSEQYEQRYELTCINLYELAMRVRSIVCAVTNMSPQELAGQLGGDGQQHPSVGRIMAEADRATSLLEFVFQEQRAE
ncbi:hypothetical protein [Actinopolyspora halophila]|uniref:hypothetical protein n=1 Tax=Actinopolyspora halophila TaxID=1850 RepID=UPI00036663E8|nr:hypothetical protein [Actinopolyspora halophila]